MKKTYMTPSQKVADLELEELICQSPTAINDTYDDAEALVKEEKGSLFGGNGNLWDDEW